MIKVEKLEGRASITRDGKQVGLFQGMLINNAEFDGVVVEGSLTVSIDEQEIKTITGQKPEPKVVAKVVEDSDKTMVASTPTKKIVQPAKRTSSNG